MADSNSRDAGGVQGQSPSGSPLLGKSSSAASRSAPSATAVQAGSSILPEQGGGDPERYLVVARRYRPRGFSQLVGQDPIARALINAIQTGRVGHAYLFTGGRGVGKTSTARIFAKALNCPAGGLHPDQAPCDTCLAIDAGEDIDVLEIDGASNRGIDEIRALRAGAGVRPSRSRYKIYIIDEVHMLTVQAFNALLKTLEEPPEHVKFIFCTTDVEKIPITVLSRCQRFDFAPVRVEAIAARLREIVDAEGASAEEDALRLLARRAAGSLRDSQSLLEQVLAFSDGTLTVQTVHAVLGTADDVRLGEITEALLSRDGRQVLEVVDRALQEGIDAGQLAEQLIGYFRVLLVATVGSEAELLRYSNPGNYPRMVELGRKTGLQSLLAIVAVLDQALVRIRHSMHGRILLDAALIQACTLPDLEGVTKLATALGRLGDAEKKNGSLMVERGPRQPPSALASPSPPAPHFQGSAVVPPPTRALASSTLPPAVSREAPAVPVSPPTLDASPPHTPADEAVAAERRVLAAEGSKTLESHSAGADQSHSAGADQSHSAGADQSHSAGADQSHSAGADQSHGAGADQSHGAGADQSHGAGADQSHGAGADQSHSAGEGKPPSGLQRRQRQRELERDPTVQRVIELFEAEIVRIDDPRSSRSG